MKHNFKRSEHSTNVYCPLCDRIITENVPKSIHHLIPKSKGGKGGETVLLHHICHKQIHLMFKEKELAKSFNKIEILKKHFGQGNIFLQFLFYARVLSFRNVPDVTIVNYQ